jgi:D-glycero-D-manno-heptose 1,7-bisphosphate phosphatase
MRPAVFLDRDGVLNRIVERDGKPASPRTPDELVIEDGVARALAELKALGFPLFVVTNQPDVARGLMSGAALDAIHARLATLLPVDEIVACRHDNADNCACRKPRPGLLTGLAARHDIDLSRSWMVGDQDRDIACGRAAGCATVLLARPYNSGLGAGATLTVESLSQAIPAIAATARTGAKQSG